MTRIIGRLTSIGLGTEASRGAGGAPTYWVPVRDLGFDTKVEMKDKESGFGNIAATENSSITKIWAEGDYTGEIYDLSAGVEMTGIFGQAPTSVQRASTGVYDHTWLMLNTNSHKSLVAAVKESNFDGRFPLCMVNSYKLEAELDDYVRRTMNLIGKKGATASDTVAYTNENEFLAAHIIVKTTTVGGDLDAASAIKARAITMEINKNAAAAFVFGSKDPDDVHNHQLEVTGDFEMFYDARTYHDLALAGTHQALRLEMINTEVTIGGVHNPALRYDISEVVLQFPERGFDNDDLVTISIPYKGVLNLAAGKVITGRLTNLYAGTNYA